MKIVYSFLVFDCPHYGHLLLLQNAKKIGDYHICGILTTKAVMSYKRKPIMPFWQRKAIAEEFSCVDMIMKQESKSPLNNLQKIHRTHLEAEIILIHGDDWKKSDFPDEKELKKINCQLVLVPYYKPLSTTKLLKKIIARDKKGDLNI